MVEVSWSPEAIRNLNLIRSYIAQFDPWAADRLAARLKATAESLAHFPERGRPAPEGTLEIATISPYVIRYEVDSESVVILTILHGRQRQLPS